MCRCALEPRRHRYTDIANALRDTWGNNSRLQAHDQHLALDVRARRLTGAVHTETVISLVQVSESGVMSTRLVGCVMVTGSQPTKTEIPEELAHIVTPAILDVPRQERHDDTDALQSLQQAVMAANAEKDASRRTRTQARYWMSERDEKS